MASVYQLKDENRVVEAAQVLSTAFAEETLSSYLLPEDERHKSVHFFEYLVRVHVRHGEVWVAEQDGRLTAVMVMETEPISDEEQMAAGVMDAMERIGPGPAERLQHFFAAVGEYRAQHYANPHYHGIAVGALPGLESLGNGLRAVEAGAESARKAGRDLYGEVLNESNLKLYTALGFEMVGEFDVASLHVVVAVKRANASAA